MKTIYLDYAAATPLDKEVLAAMKPYLTDEFYNPSATYLAGKRAKQALNNARSEVAQVLGSRPAEVIFTAGATEANNLAIQGALRQFPEGEVLVSAVEHESVLAPAALFKCSQIPVDKSGVVVISKLTAMITDKTSLISVMFVSNELGTVQPIKDVARLLQEVRKYRLAKGVKMPIYLHSDAAQAANYLDLKVSRLGVDLMSLNGGKIYGPKQSGALYIKAGTILQPLIMGGGQEYGYRAGSENLASAVGFTKALNEAQNRRIAESLRISELRTLFAIQLQKAIPGSVINGSVKHMAPHILSVTFAGLDNERLMMQLDEAGVMAATGSACNASSDLPSHALSAIGLSDGVARSTLRFSLGRMTAKDQITYCVDMLKRLVESDR